jgi:hypothetical protein
MDRVTDGGCNVTSSDGGCCNVISSDGDRNDTSSDAGRHNTSSDAVSSPDDGTVSDVSGPNAAPNANTHETTDASTYIPDISTHKI